jgi:uncharacterized membrane protein YfcA
VDPLVVLFGLGVGILVGMTGIGGGSLMTPVLILVFGIKPVTAVGTDLTYGAVTKTVGGWRHLRFRTVDTSISTWMAFGSVPAAIGGVYVLHALEHAVGKQFDKWTIAVVSAALLLTGTAVLARALLLPNVEERDRVELTRRNKIAAVLLGLFVGFVLGMTSAGSGSLIAVGLIMLFRLAPKQVVATDIFHAAILLWAAAAAHVVAGNVDWGLAGTILVGSIPGVWLGSRWSSQVHAATLRLGLAVVLIGSGLALLSKAGAAIPPALIAAVPVLLGAVVIWKERGLRAEHRAHVARLAERDRAGRTAAGAVAAPAGK